MQRLVTTLLILALTTGARFIPLPGLDLSRLPPGPLLPSVSLSVALLWLHPFVNAFLCVECVAWLVPRWRRHRSTGTGRTKLDRTALITGLTFAGIQAFGVATYLESSDLGVTSDGYSKVVTMLTAIAGSSALLLGARSIDRYGLGSGFGWLMAVDSLASSWSSYRRWSLTAPQDAPVLIALIGLSGVALAWLFLHTDRSSSGSQDVPKGEHGTRPRSVPISFPVTGIVPITAAYSLMTLPFQWQRLGLDPSAAADALANSTTRLLITATLIVGLGFACGIAFYRLPNVMAAAERFGVAVDRPGLFESRRKASRTAVVTLAGLSLLACGADLDRAVFDLVVIAWCVALALDVHREVRARLQAHDWVEVATLSRGYVADLARVRLSELGIPLLLRNVHLRSLLQFFGPYVPMPLLVPAEAAPRAREVLADIV